MAGAKRYLAPAAFLLAATIAVLLIRAGIRSGRHHDTPTTTATPPAATVTRTSVTRTVAPKRRYWVVRAGDTFGTISSRSGVPIATIQHLNPTVKPTALFIGERIRLQ